MKISGIILADILKRKLAGSVAKLKEKDITPHLAIVKTLQIPQVDNYIRQKVKAGHLLGITVTVHDLTDPILTKDEIHQSIAELNSDGNVHGIILQKPSRQDINEEAEELISLHKDVDAFLTDSSYFSPVFKAVQYIVEYVQSLESDWNSKTTKTFLQQKRICIIGKGKTGGGPVINGLQKMEINSFVVIDSKTTECEKEKLIRNADIIISAVGKRGTIDTSWLKKEQILIDVGVHFVDGRIKGDFDEDIIKDTVSYYTATPGGVGPLTVVGLLENTVESVQQQV